jgi:hypothetical protein
MRVKQRQEELQGATEEVPAYSALGSRQKKKMELGKMQISGAWKCMGEKVPVGKAGGEAV